MVKKIKTTFDCKKNSLSFKKIPVCSYQKSIDDEIKDKNLTKKSALNLLEQMHMVRTLEEMLAQIKAGIYKPLKGFAYTGPTHLSIGQEATSVGAISAISATDYITSSHRGHGDALAKGCAVIESLDDKGLKKLLKDRKVYLKAIGKNYNGSEGKLKLEELAKKVHLYRMISELFGKTHGYCRGVGGGMHIADFSLGHLGANAIVGGHVPIATGAAMGLRYKKQKSLVLSLAGDGAFSNGAVLESLNLASMAQFRNGLLDRKFGLPIIFAIVNNQYAMSGQESGEITGVDFLARRAAGFDLNLMHAEVVDGMDILAIRDATARAKKLIEDGKGPVLLEFMTYRYKGHSLSDPLTYRDREELKTWRERDGIKTFEEKITGKEFTGGKITTDDIKALKEKVEKRNQEMAKYAAEAESPKEDSLLHHLFSSKSYKIPKEAKPEDISLPEFRKKDGKVSSRLAIRKALAEKMAEDRRVLVFGEDVADYGGAFGVTDGLLKLFGRERIFNTSISESAIVGSAVGLAMAGLRPVVEIMYNDFIMQALGQIGNQAAKWSYMSGGQVSIPLVLRTTIGGGRGYAGQHSQSLEALTTHIPGLKVMAPATVNDCYHMLRSAIEDENPVMFFEHQLLYNLTGKISKDPVPIGKANILKEGDDVSIICWSYMVEESIKAAKLLEDEGISAEVVDIRSLIPLDIDTIGASIKKTNKAVVTAQEVSQGGFMAEVLSQINENVFDWLDAPVLRYGAPNCIPPSASNLEKLFLPNGRKLAQKVMDNF